MPQKYRDGNPPGISRCYGTKEANSVVYFDGNLMNRLMGDGSDCDSTIFNSSNGNVVLEDSFKK
jgi:hypothetical protein